MRRGWRKEEEEERILEMEKVDELQVEQDWWWSLDDLENRPGNVVWWRMGALVTGMESSVLMDVLEMVAEIGHKEIQEIVIDHDLENG